MGKGIGILVNNGYAYKIIAPPGAVANAILDLSGFIWVDPNAAVVTPEINDSMVIIRDGKAYITTLDDLHAYFNAPLQAIVVYNGDSVMYNTINTVIT